MKTIKTIFLIAACVSELCAQTHWVGTWAAAPAPQFDPLQMRERKLDFNNQTLREIVHVTIGGDSVRVRLSNAFGSAPVEIGAAHIALRTSGASINAASDHVLKFSDRNSIQIPAGAVVLSDPVRLPLKPSSDLAISLFIPGAALGGGVHYSAQQTSYIVSGDATGSATLDNPTAFTSWAFLTGVDVAAAESTGSIVAFGDSITDGARSTNDTNSRWPNFLANRLLHTKDALSSQWSIWVSAATASCMKAQLRTGRISA